MKIGDWVVVERGGDVIPKVTQVIDDKEHPRGHKIFTCRRSARCAADTSCAPKAKPTIAASMPTARRSCGRRILHFASRGVMNIEGMGDALVNQLTERAW